MNPVDTEGEVADGARGGGETIGEDFVISIGRLLDEGHRFTVEAKDASGAAKGDAMVVLATTKHEVVNGIACTDG